MTLNDNEFCWFCFELVLVFFFFDESILLLQFRIGFSSYLGFNHNSNTPESLFHFQFLFSHWPTEPTIKSILETILIEHCRANNTDALSHQSISFEQFFMVKFDLIIVFFVFWSKDLIRSVNKSIVLWLPACFPCVQEWLPFDFPNSNWMTDFRIALASNGTRKRKTNHKIVEMKWAQRKNKYRSEENQKKMKTFIIVVYVSQTDVFRKRINWCNDDSGCDDNETKPKRKHWVWCVCVL